MIPKDKIEMAKRADLPRVLQAMGIEPMARAINCRNMTA